MPKLKNLCSDCWPRSTKSFRGPRPTPSYLYKSRLHFKKTALPLDPEALDLQNPEISSSKEPPHAATLRQKPAMTNGLILEICANQATNSENGPYHGLLRPLMTKKSKFSKGACLTQFFEYIPILGSVSSFETWKLCKRPTSKKLTFA